ncbi:MAG: hypothetical protein SOZ52_05915 [Pyramidobacter sp.]|nr:hypothetical protein [Pyramidobacter sp.]
MRVHQLHFYPLSPITSASFQNSQRLFFGIDISTDMNKNPELQSVFGDFKMTKNTAKFIKAEAAQIFFCAASAA